MENNILILAPHTDDGEYGCGGTISKLIDMGNTVNYIAFSACEKSVPEEFPRDVLKEEVKEATKLLGISEENLYVLSYPVREFPLYRQSILDDMLKFKMELKPDIIFLPCSDDTHQDHQVIAREGFRAYKDSTILGYEVPWNMSIFKTELFVVLSEKDIVTKIKAMECYKSQMKKDSISEEFFRGLAITRGSQINSKYAEAFEVVRMVVK